jgi:hypothetical protein
MTFINEASGICLSPTGGTGECPTSDPCVDNRYVRSGQVITIANTCNMPLTISGFHNDNPQRFTIINYPEFSGSGYYTTGNVTGNPDTLPRILEPGENWEIMTWWHPKKWEVENGDVGTPARPTGTAQSAKISVFPGDLGFADCANYFTLSGELICDRVPITLGTGALGTYVQTLTDLPDPPPTTVCLQNSKYVYESFTVYPSATALHDDQPEGLYQLMHWIGRQISGRADENPRIRNISKGFAGAVSGVVDGGGDGNLDNLFAFPIALGNSVLYNFPATDDAGDPWTGSFKTSTVVPTGSGTLMQLGQGYTGINILESRYDDVGAGFAWQNQNNNYGVYVSSGLTNANNLTARVFIAQSGYQSLREGTTIENSICTQPTSLDLGAGPAVAGPVEGDFDYLHFSKIAFLSPPAATVFNLFILPDAGAVAAISADYPLIGFFMGGAQAQRDSVIDFTIARKGGVILTTNNSANQLQLQDIKRQEPVTHAGRLITNDPFPMNPGDISKANALGHTWSPGPGIAGDDVLRGVTVFDLNDNGNGALRFASEWIVNGDIEIANGNHNTVVQADGTLIPGELPLTKMTDIAIVTNLTTHNYIHVSFLTPITPDANFILRGGT